MDTQKEFKQYLEDIDSLIHVKHKLVSKLPKKEFLELIELNLPKTKSLRIFQNLVRLLINTDNEISDKIVHSLFENIVCSNPPYNYDLRIYYLCEYIAHFKKKDYCRLLKKALHDYIQVMEGEEVDILLQGVIDAVQRLKCTECKDLLSNLVEKGTSINGRVSFGAKKAIGALYNENGDLKYD